jgi:hypothetical protein
LEEIQRLLIDGVFTDPLDNLECRKKCLHPTTSLPSIFINLQIPSEILPKQVSCLHMAMCEVDQDDYPYHTTALVTTTLLSRPLKDIKDMVEIEHIHSYNFRPKEEDRAGRGGNLLQQGQGGQDAQPRPDQLPVCGATDGVESGPPDSLSEGDHHLHAP